MAEPKLTFAELLAQYEESRPKTLDERFTQPVPPEAGPFQQIIPEEETYRDMAERTLAGALGDDREAYRRAGTLLRTADEIPVLGDVTAATDVLQALKDRDIAGLGIAGLGFIPGMAGMARKIRGSGNEQMELPFETRASDQLPFTTSTSIEQPPNGIGEPILGRQERLENLREERRQFRETVLRDAKEKEQGAQEKLMEDQGQFTKKTDIIPYNKKIKETQAAVKEAEQKERELTIKLRDELPDDIIARDSKGNPLSENEFRQANVMGFHGASESEIRRSIDEGGLYQESFDPAFYFTDAPAPARSYGTDVLPARIDTREFAVVDMGQTGYAGAGIDSQGNKILGNYPNIISIESPVEITVFGQTGKNIEVSLDVLDQNTDDLVFELSDQVPGIIFNDFADLDPMGFKPSPFLKNAPLGTQRRGSYEAQMKSYQDFEDKLPYQQVVVVLDKSKQRLAKGNPRTLFDKIKKSEVIGMEPESGFNQGGQVQKFANGGMVNSMNRFPQAGPLARQPFSRETMAPMGYDNGGGVTVPMPTPRAGLEQPLDERFTQPGPYDMGPLQQIIPEEETYRDMVERSLAGVLGDDRQAYRRAGKLLDAADQIPVLGDATAAADVLQAVKDVDPVGIGIASLGVIPGVKNIRGLFKNKKFDQTTPILGGNREERFNRAAEMGFDVTRPVYHGTNVNFDRFDQKQRGTYTGAKDSKLGFFFTDNPKMASTYVETDLEPYATTKNFLIKAAEKVTKGFYGKFNDTLLKTLGQQPLTPEAPQVLPLFLRRGKEKVISRIPDSQQNEYKEEFFTQELKKAQEEGYDSVTFKDIDDVLWRKGQEKPEQLTGDVTIVFDPANVRSVNADFNPDFKDSAELLKAQGGEVQSFQTGGTVFGVPDFTGRLYTQNEEEDVTAAENLAATTQETTMPAGLNRLQQELVASGDLQLEDLGYPKNTVKGTDPTVTSVFQTTTPAEDLIDATTETTTEPVTETTTEPVITTTTEPVTETTTTTEPVTETTTEPVIATTEPVIATTEPVVTEPLTPWPTTTDTTTEPVIETTTEPVITTTTEPVVDTSPLVVTEPLASEELATTTEGEPISLVPSPTAEDVPMFTVQDQPDAPDEQPFVPITGVSPDLSVNQYLDTTYQTGYPTTQGMEIKESLIPGQEYSAERLAAGEMIDVIKPDLGSGAELPSVDFSNIGFGTPEEEVETELYEKPEFISTDPTTGQDPDFASGPTPQDFLADSRTGDPINWKTVGEGTMDFLTNPLRGLEGLASNVADRIWSNRPEFFLSTHVKNADGTLKLDTNGKPIRRNGMGTLINRVLDKIYEERPNILFKEYINEGEELEGEVYGTLRDKTKPTEEVSDKTEAGQQTFLDRLWSGLGEGLNMMNPFKYLQGGDQQFVGEQPMFPTTTPVTLTDVTFDEEGNPVFTNKRFLGEIQGTNLSAAQRRQFYDFYTNLSDYDRAVADRARSPEYKALYDSMNFDAEGNATAETPYDAQLQLLNFVDPEGTSTIPSVVTARNEEKRIATMKTNMAENGYTEEQVYELGQKALQGDVAAMQDLMALQGRSQDFIDTYIRSFERAQQGGRAREAYEMASGGANRWGTARMGSIQERGSGFSSGSYHVGSGGQGVQYSAVPNEPDAATRGGWRGTQSIVAGTGRLPAAGGSWGGLNPFFEVPQPGDPMYADYLMDTMGPGKNFENEIQAMVERDLPFVQVTDGQGNGYLINKETGDIMFGPFPVSDTDTGGGGGTGPGGGMAEGGPVVRNVGEAEGIAGLFEDMMGPGTVDETERVYEYPGGTMTERVSRGSFNLRTG
jgi:hypothetical protein